MPFSICRSQRLIVGALPATCLTVFLLTGCGAAPNSGATASKSSSAAGAHDDHEHPEEGPHHGHLVELGNEEYHAEIVHAEGGTVTVYILDGSAKNVVPIEATEVTINLSHEAQAEQFKLAASPDSGDPTGKSSRFVAEEEHLGKDLDTEESAAKLVVTIEGKQYTGKIEHEHSHKDGEHKHEAE